MTYRAGIGAALAAMFGGARRAEDPTLSCDVIGCDTVLVVRPVRGGAPAWLRNQKAPKGWRRCPQPDGPAQHLCPACNAALQGNK